MERAEGSGGVGGIGETRKFVGKGWEWADGTYPVGKSVKNDIYGQRMRPKARGFKEKKGDVVLRGWGHESVG